VVDLVAVDFQVVELVVIGRIRFILFSIPLIIKKTPFNPKGIFV
jgi:hypothetical protein